MRPQGQGARLFLSFADDKFGGPLRRHTGASDARIGVLVADPTSPDTENPIALVCEFSERVDHAVLREAHRLAWNFGRTPLLITVEPTLIRAWTCCEPPEQQPSLLQLAAEIPEARVDERSLSTHASHELHWIRLISGDFFRDYAPRFPKEGRADEQLLKNLQGLRRELKSLGLSSDVSHDLLARVIFIQFLFDRKDSSGRPALDAAVLEQLHEQGIFHQLHPSFTSILESHQETYSFFRWLNHTFNGDLFPGKGRTAPERETEWREEMRQVSEDHLKVLADFVGGRTQFGTEQLALWPMYSFESIPLEFVSSVYETFIDEDQRRKGAVYTPSFLVDFVLDRVIPWNSTDWNLRVLDPSCGSGIFLVKAFKRLVHRWRLAHQAEPGALDLTHVLEHCIHGIDIDPHAVRVASFSLYLALCEELDPKLYLTEIMFPRLRDVNLRHADFFTPTSLRANPDGPEPVFDAVIGNAPWGRRTLTEAASEWGSSGGWSTSYHDIGPLFLVKGAAHLAPGGAASILQPAGGMLFNRVPTALVFRQRFFNEFEVVEVVNLSTLRFGLFADAIAPSCLVTYRQGPPANNLIRYVSPKPTGTAEDQFKVVIEPHDEHLVTQSEASSDPWIWTALAWGGRRDLNLIHRLASFPTLGRLWRRGLLAKRQGVIRGDRKKRQDHIVGRRILDEAEFPKGTFLRLNGEVLDVNDDPHTHSRDSSGYEAFELPQLIVKQGWRKEHGRFEAAMVDPESVDRGILCSKSYVSFHADPQNSKLLENACVIVNSKVALYYLMLTSGRFASYRPEVNVEDLLELPVPLGSTIDLSQISDYSELDRVAASAFGLNRIEDALMEDVVSITLPGFKDATGTIGWRSTRFPNDRSSSVDSEPLMSTYCQYFIDVLRAGFGTDKEISATIYREAGPPLPLRLVAIHLVWPGRSGTHVERIDDKALLETLACAEPLIGLHGERNGGFIRHRFLRTYSEIRDGKTVVPTVFLLKPDRAKYWTRSAALRDADEVSAEIMLSRAESHSAEDRRGE